MPRGGKREGAGRPKGSRDVLPRGAVTALRAMRFRVPEGTAEAVAEVAGEAFEAVVEVLRDDWKKQGAGAKLAAAAAIREEVCGPVPKRHEVTGKDGEALTVVIKTYKREPQNGD